MRVPTGVVILNEQSFLRQASEGSNLLDPSSSQRRLEGLLRMTGCAFLIIFLFILIFAPHCYGETVSSSELIEQADQFNGRIVEYKGEVVTAVIRRGAHSWINVNDGLNAIGVWCDASSVNDVEFTGSYRFKGDIVEVKGIFHRACPIHGGELDIHAGSVRVIERGHIVRHSVSMRLITSSAVLFLILFATVAVFRKRL